MSINQTFVFKYDSKKWYSKTKLKGTEKRAWNYYGTKEVSFIDLLKTLKILKNYSKNQENIEIQIKEF
ncbi:hypothetical protein, partial [Mycoplasmopsis cricetuli]